MREYINRLAQGKFIYENPKLNFSGIDFPVEVVNSEDFTGCFYIESENPVKGIVYSDNPRVIMEDNNFNGRHVAVKYRVDSNGCHSKDRIEGRFVIESNAGETEIQYSFVVTDRSVETSLGKANDLFHFANLVQKAEEEAKRVFESPDFKDVFIGKDTGIRNIYDTLYNDNNVRYSMEEFLIAIKKKQPVTLKLDENGKDFYDLESDEKDYIEISRSGWGYFSAQVKTDADFLVLDKSVITSEDFTGDKYELGYLIKKDRLHAGNNYASIIISSHNCELHFLISVSHKERQAVNDNIKEIRNAEISLTKEYLSYRNKEIVKDAWISHSNKILDRVRGITGGNAYFSLVQAQMHCIASRDEEAEWLLNNVKAECLAAKETNAELYCFYLYVESLLRKDDLFTDEVLRTVKEEFVRNNSSWRILWLLFYLDAEYDRNKSIRLVRIKDVYNQGCTSPIMYIEALSILNSQPVLLRVLNRFELQVIRYGCKKRLIKRQLAVQIAECISSEKVASPYMLEILKMIYKEYEEDDILNVLVSQMIRNGVTTQESHDIYEKAILRGLKITRLYEFYIYSSNKSLSDRLPKLVIMYFAYDAQLDYANKAFLYANLTANKESYGELYNNYSKDIEMFVYEQMKAGHIDDNLAYLYKKFWSVNLLHEETAQFMSKLIFMYKVTCYDNDVISVIVKHKESAECEIYDLADSKAFVPVYTENCTVAFMCKDGAVRKDSVNYEIEKVFEDISDKASETLKKLDELSGFDYIIHKNSEIVFHKIAALKKKGEHDEHFLALLKEAVQSDEISDDYRKQINSMLIEYYNKYYSGDDFESEISYIDSSDLSVKDSSRLAEVFIDNGMYNAAYEILERYGYVMMLPAKLLKVIVYILEGYKREYNRFLVELCEYTFTAHIYNETTLTYMIDYYNGPNSVMYRLWKSGCNFGVDVNALSERIIAQMLFTGEHTGQLTEVFTDYYDKVSVNVIIKAYIAYYAHYYLIKQKKANDIVFKVISNCFYNGIGMPHICLVAMLKEISKHPADRINDNNREELQKLLNELCNNDEIYQFYNSFKGYLEIPYNAYGVTVVEYIANPEYKVTIHYSVNDSGEYTDEIMKCTESGIFTKRFVLFHGDRLKYYFTENGNGETVNTEEKSYVSDNVDSEVSQGRLDRINDCLASKELHDMATLRRLMHGYCVENYVNEQLFKPMK